MEVFHRVSKGLEGLEGLGAVEDFGAFESLHICGTSKMKDYEGSVGVLSRYSIGHEQRSLRLLMEAFVKCA